jgi:hypothetical protein
LLPGAGCCMEIYALKTFFHIYSLPPCAKVYEVVSME